MDEIEKLRRYGKYSAAKDDVNVDVTGRVMATLRNRQEQPVLSLRPLAAVAAASWMAVLGTALLVQDAWSSLQDPVASLVSSFVVTMQ